MFFTFRKINTSSNTNNSLPTIVTYSRGRTNMFQNVQSNPCSQCPYVSRGIPLDVSKQAILNKK